MASLGSVGTAFKSSQLVGQRQQHCWFRYDEVLYEP